MNIMRNFSTLRTYLQRNRPSKVKLFLTGDFQKGVSLETKTKLRWFNGFEAQDLTSEKLLQLIHFTILKFNKRGKINEVAQKAGQMLLDSLVLM